MNIVKVDMIIFGRNVMPTETMFDKMLDTLIKIKDLLEEKL